MTKKRQRSLPWLYRWSRPLMGGIAIAGALTTGYLTVSKLLNQSAACPIKSCEQVLNSAYATVLGVPLSLWGFFAYATMAVLALSPLVANSFSDRQQRQNLEQWTAQFLFIGATAMVIFSGYLMYLLAFQLHTACPYCIVSALFCLSLFILTVTGRDWVDRGQLIFVGITVAIITIVVTIEIYSNTVSLAKTPDLDQPISQELVQNLKQASQQGLTFKSNQPKSLLQAIPGGSANSQNPPEVVYIGADYCPYCATLRWSLALALWRFGDLSGLRYMRSSSTDVFPNTPTFSFYQSNYQSSYLSFTPAELEDREGKPLQPLTPAQQRLFDKYDKPPYTDIPGVIPFVYIGGRYVLVGAPFSPKVLDNLSWQQIAAQLQDPHSQIAQQVMPSVNMLSAAFCQVTRQAPKDVCQAPGVVAAAASLPR